MQPIFDVRLRRRQPTETHVVIVMRLLYGIRADVIQGYVRHTKLARDSTFIVRHRSSQSLSHKHFLFRHRASS